jgi:outer membrane protein TolC
MPKKSTAELAQPLPFPFDVKQALVAIIGKNADVERARALYERRKADAKTAKETLDELEAALGDLIGDYEQRMLGRPEAEPVPAEPLEEPGG